MILEAMTAQRAEPPGRLAASAGGGPSDPGTRPGTEPVEEARPASAPPRDPGDRVALEVALLVAGEQRFAVPAAAVVHEARLSREEADAVAEEGEFRLAGRSVPAVRLSGLLGSRLRFPEPSDEPVAVVVAAAGRRVALLADYSLRPGGVHFQPLAEAPLAASWLSGSGTTLSGERAAVLNPAELVRRHGGDGSSAAASAPEEETPALLIADATATTRQALSDLAADLGYRPLLARDGFAVIERLSQPSAAPALLILDAELSGIGAGELLALLQAQGVLRKVPVVLLTSVAGDLTSPAVSGASASLLRPFRSRTAAAVIRLLAATGDPSPDDGHDPGR